MIGTSTARTSTIRARARQGRNPHGEAADRMNVETSRARPSVHPRSQLLLFTHTPFMQVSYRLGSHTFPHEPQLLVSDDTSMHPVPTQ
jgi:hypothetical protein